MKLKKRLERWLLSVGFLLLAFCAVAKLHELILSRASIRRFDDLRQAKPHISAKQRRALEPPSSPDFVSWSQQRVKEYEKSLTAQTAPPLAVIRISRLHVEAPVLEGTDDITLNRGVGHIAGTALFGEGGNVGIGGHRDGFFRGLKNIKLGDRIEMEEPGRSETYIVNRIEIVSPKNVSVLRSNTQPEVTLVTCYPFYYIGGAPQRFIVHADLAARDPEIRTESHSAETDRAESGD